MSAHAKTSAPCAAQYAKFILVPVFRKNTRIVGGERPVLGDTNVSYTNDRDRARFFSPFWSSSKLARKGPHRWPVTIRKILHEFTDIGRSLSVLLFRGQWEKSRVPIFSSIFSPFSKAEGPLQYFNSSDKNISVFRIFSYTLLRVTFILFPFSVEYLILKRYADYRQQHDKSRFLLFYGYVHCRSIPNY